MAELQNQPDFELHFQPDQDSTSPFIHESHIDRPVVAKRPRLDEKGKVEPSNGMMTQDSHDADRHYFNADNNDKESAQSHQASTSGGLASANSQPEVINHELQRYASYSELLRDLGQESKMVILQYSQILGDSEVYEQDATQAITDLTAHARLLQRNLNDQKQMLCSHLESICDSLKHES